MNTMTRIIITGATGFIGINLLMKLKELGNYYIISIIRDPSKAVLIKQWTDEIKLADLNDTASLKGIFEGAQVCIHLAGLTKSTNIDDFYKNNYFAFVNLIKEAISYGRLKHFIHLSSIAASGPDHTASGMREYMPPKPVSSYGQTKLLAELYLKNTGLPFTILRPPIVYGPHDRDVYSFFKMTKIGIVPMIGRKKRYSVIFVEDLTNIISRIILNRKSLGKIYNISENISYSMEDIIRTIARSMGKRPLLVPIPQSFLLFLAPVYELIVRLTGMSPLLTRDKLLEIIQKGWVADPSRIKNELGLSAVYGLAEGTKLTRNWYKDNKWL